MKLMQRIRPIFLFVIATLYVVMGVVVWRISPDFGFSPTLQKAFALLCIIYGIYRLYRAYGEWKEAVEEEEE